MRKPLNAFAIALPIAGVPDVGQPSEDELKAFYEKHQDLFRAPEYRKIIYVAITPEEIGKWTEVTDEDAKKQYPQGWKAPKPYIRIVPQPKA